MIYVLDTNVVVAACKADDGFKLFGKAELIAPRLMWSEANAVIRSAAWRTEVTREQELMLLSRLEQAPVKVKSPKGLIRRANELACQLGHAKTYDAEFLALAEISGGKLVTLDRRLSRGAQDLDLTLTPDEI